MLRCGRWEARSVWSALLSNTSGAQNTANGAGALFSNTTGNNNAAVGVNALFNMTSGTQNIALGYQAGFNFTGSESDNIDIGSMGIAGESGIIRIGTSGTHTGTFIAGTISGDGGGLTNLNAAQFSSGIFPLARLPAALVTNDASGVILNGSFNGSGAGLTNLPASGVSGGLSINLPVLIPGGTTNILCFTNGILMSIQ